MDLVGLLPTEEPLIRCLNRHAWRPGL